MKTTDRSYRIHALVSIINIPKEWINTDTEPTSNLLIRIYTFCLLDIVHRGQSNFPFCHTPLLSVSLSNRFGGGEYVIM